MYSSCPRPILKRHDQSPNNTSHINNTAANTLSNSHYQYHPQPSPRVYTQNHHNYAPHHALPNTSPMPMPIAPGSIYSPTSKPSSTSTRSCTVHFPPSPALTSTFACHSSTVYDRSPIVVVPNTCALPERGCPGRTYALGSEEEDEEADEYDNCLSTSSRKEKRKTLTKTARDRDFHPRAIALAAAAASAVSSSTAPSSFSAFGPPGSGLGITGVPSVSATTPYSPASLSAAYYAHNYDHLPVPALVHDLSSESDESDGVSGLPAQITGYMSALSLNPSVAASPNTKGVFGLDDYFPTAGADVQERGERKEKAHRRRGSRERAPRHERSSDPDRIPGLASAVPSSPIPISSFAPPASQFSSYSSSPPSTISSYPLSASPPSSYCSSPSPRKKGVRRSYPTSTSLGLGCGGFGAQEEGCLGGF